MEKGEPVATAAAREVREETGLDGEVEGQLDKIDYWFIWKEDDGRSVRHHKLVHFFLMRHTGGDTSLHDHEVDEARWFPISEAIKKVAFANERKVVEKARPRIDRQTPTGRIECEPLRNPGPPRVEDDESRRRHSSTGTRCCWSVSSYLAGSSLSLPGARALVDREPAGSRGHGEVKATPSRALGSGQKR